MLKSREADVKTVLAAQPDWWGKARGQRHRDRLHADQVRRDAHRRADLGRGRLRARPAAAGHRPPAADASSRSSTGPRTASSSSAWTRRATSCCTPTSRAGTRSRTCGCARRSTRRSTSRRSSRTLMRGLAVPTGAVIPPQVNGYTEDTTKRLPYDVGPRAARCWPRPAIPNGFEVTLDCPNNRYINDEEICQAVVAMWAQIGVQGEAQRDAARDLLPEDPEVTTPASTCSAGASRRFDGLYTLPEPDPHRRPAGQRGRHLEPTASYSNPRCRRADRHR